MGLSIDELLRLTIRQFLNALHGKYEYDARLRESNRDILFSAIQWNAGHIAKGLSGKLSDAILNHSFRWNKPAPQKGKKLTYGELVAQFDNKLKKN